MKKQLLPAVAMVGGTIAFVLRLLQNRTGFEANTGLPIPGAPAGITLVIWLAVVSVALFLLARQLPDTAVLSFPTNFATTEPTTMTLPVAGILLIAAAGLADLYEGFGTSRLLTQLQAAADPHFFILKEPAGFSPRAQLLLALLSLLSAAALFAAVAACRHAESTSFHQNLLLIPPAALVVRLVLTYRLDSVNPVLEAYYPELLALIFLTLGFYRLSSFAFQSGCIRRFSLYSCLGIVLCCAALADSSPHLSSLLLYTGGAVTLMGFLLLAH